MVATPRDTRASIIRAFTFLGGIYFFVYFILPDSAVVALGMKSHHEQISNGFIVVGVMAIGLGLFNIIRGHGARCIFQRSGWVNSLALLVGLFAMIGVAVGQWVSNNAATHEVRRVQVIGDFAARIVEDASSPAAPPLARRIAALSTYTTEEIAKIHAVDSSSPLVAEVRQKQAVLAEEVGQLSARDWSALTDDNKALLKKFAQDAARLSSAYSVLRQSEGSRSTINKAYDFLFDGLFNQLGSAMFALLGVYIAAAAYRAFRVRTLEAALMMIAAVIVMLGQISFGKQVYEHMPDLRQWLLEVPNSAAFRAIRLGAGVAGLLLAIRMWLSIESKSFSSEGKK